MQKRSIFQSLRERAEDPQGMRDFTLLWIGQSVSLVGSGMTCFAQSVHAYTNLGGQISNLAILAFLAYLPGIIVSPVAGLIADRWNRRWIMFVCNGVAALATLVLRSLVVSGALQIWHMYLLVIVISTANHFQWPAFFAAVPTMVPFKQLGRANGMVQMARSMGQIAAPALAGWMVVVMKLQGVILFDMLSYLFAAATLLYVAIPRTRPSSEDGLAGSGFLRAIASGWTFLTAKPGLIGLLGLFAAANFVFAASTVLIMPLALSLTSVEVYGLVATIGGAGSLAGSSIMGVWGGPKRRIFGVFAALALEASGLVLIGARPSLVFLMLGYTLVCLSGPFVNACSGTIWQSKVPVQIQGRVMAASVMVSTLALQIGYLTTGHLAEMDLNVSAVGHILLAWFGPGAAVDRHGWLGPLLVIMGGVQLVAVAAGLLYPRLRRLDEELPNTIEMHAASEVDRLAAGAAVRQIDLTSA